MTAFCLIGCKNKSEWDMWKSLFHCDYFKVNCVADDHTVELCGALKVYNENACIVFPFIKMHTILH